MKLPEYQTQQRRLSSSLVAALIALLNPFRQQRLSQREWGELLQAMYVQVDDYRRRSAKLAREFYDTERQEHIGERQDIDLPTYRFEWFAEAMQPVRHRLSVENADESTVSDAALRAVKEAENGGRRTMMDAVRSEERSVQWARVATGRETCGFCMMLVSRGPDYTSARSAGLNTDDRTAMQLVGAGDHDAMSKLMVRWHPGCDCKLVPVFNRRSWPGRDAYLKAQRLWRMHTEGKSGKDALNALRRAVESGQIDPRSLKAA